MPELQGTETQRLVEQCFARESQAAMRYRFFAQQADIEGEPDVAARFRTLADGATGHAMGHLELLVEVADPATGILSDDVAGSVASAVESETLDHTALYPEVAETARGEGFTEIAAWMDTVAKADHHERFGTTGDPDLV